MRKIKLSRKREQDSATDTSGKRHIRSGGLWWNKGDASNVDFLFEDKFTEKEQYSVTGLVINKVEKEALSVNKLPILRIGFVSKYGNSDYAIIRYKDCNIASTEYTKIPFEISNKKSICLSSSRLRGLQISGDKFVMRFWLIDKEYIVVNWSMFLELKDKIMKGVEL